MLPEVGLGTWKYNGGVAPLRRGIDLGAFLIDTAEIYRTEDVVGEAIRGRRDEVFVATKVSGDNLRYEQVLRAAEGSLKRLGIETIDLYQVHWPDRTTPSEETGAALAQLRDEGKIRHVGVSNFSPAEMDELSRTIEVETDQPPYNLFNRGVEEDVLPYCREQDVGLLVYGPLSHGLLSGNFDPSTLADDDWRRGHEPFEGDNLERNTEVVGRLERFAEERGHTLAQLAVAWVLAQPGVHVAITGARRPAHIEGIAPAANIELTGDELAEIDELTGAAKAWGLTPEG
jgi:aryl-alcohol dehydrogenase-like predicted oxidoreductase